MSESKLRVDVLTNYERAPSAFAPDITLVRLVRIDGPEQVTPIMTEAVHALDSKVNSLEQAKNRADEIRMALGLLKMYRVTISGDISCRVECFDVKAASANEAMMKVFKDNPKIKDTDNISVALKK